MRRSRGMVLTVAILVLFGILISLALGAPKQADTKTHLGQKAGDHVVLKSVDTDNSGIDFIRLFPDGTSGQCNPSTLAGCFRVPADRVLIVTDVDWQYDGDTAGEHTLLLFIENQANPAMRSNVHVSVINVDPSNFGGKRVGGASEQMTSGFVVSPGARITADLDPDGSRVAETGTITNIILRGYLGLDQ